MSEHNQARVECHQNLILNPQNLSQPKTTDLPKKNQPRRGQVVVEYVLLLVIAVGIAGLTLKSCVSRNEDEAGVVVQFWSDVLDFIGADEADEP